MQSKKQDRLAMRHVHLSKRGKHHLLQLKLMLHLLSRKNFTASPMADNHNDHMICMPAGNVHGP